MLTLLKLQAWSDVYAISNYKEYSTNDAFQYNGGENYYIHSCSFKNLKQYTVDNYGGGAIRYISYSITYLLIENSVFEFCSSELSGGAMYLITSGYSHITKICGYGCQLLGNEKIGHFLYSQGDARNNSINMVSVSGCGNPGYGNSHIISCYRGKQFSTNVNLSNCQSYSYAGIIHSQPTSGCVRFSQIFNNKAMNNGLFHFDGGIHSAEYCNIIENSPITSVATVDGSTFTFIGCYFNNNNAEYFAIVHSGFLNLFGCILNGVNKTIGKISFNNENQIFGINSFELLASAQCETSKFPTVIPQTPNPTPKPTIEPTLNPTPEISPKPSPKPTPDQSPLETPCSTPKESQKPTVEPTLKQTPENTPNPSHAQITLPTPENTPIEPTKLPTTEEISSSSLIISTPAKTASPNATMNPSMTKTIIETTINTQTQISIITSCETEYNKLPTFTETEIITDTITNIVTNIETIVLLEDPIVDVDENLNKYKTFIIVLASVVFAIIFLLLLICCLKKCRNQDEFSAYGLSTSVHLLKSESNVTFISPMKFTSEESNDDPFKDDFISSYIEEVAI